MSQENVEVVRASIEAANRGDLDALVKEAGPGFELDFSRSLGPWRGVYGVDEVRQVSDEFNEAWESFRYELEEFIEAGEHVVTPFTNYLQGRDGIEVQARGTWVWTLREGAIVRVTLYQELEEALEGAGLSE